MNEVRHTESLAVSLNGGNASQEVGVRPNLFIEHCSYLLCSIFFAVYMR